MVIEKSAESEREAFISATLAQWSEIKRGDATAGNRKQKEADKIVDKWGKRNLAFTMLEFLLSHESPAVRLASAAHIIKYGGASLAVPVLVDLSKGHLGPISTFADAVLRAHPLLRTASSESNTSDDRNG